MKKAVVLLLYILFLTTNFYLAQASSLAAQENIFLAQINKEKPQGGEGISPSEDIVLINPLGSASFGDVLQRIWNGLIAISAPIVAIMVIYGGYQMLFAAGNPEKFKTGQKTILYAAIGFAAVLLAGGIISIIKSILGA